MLPRKPPPIRRNPDQAGEGPTAEDFEADEAAVVPLLEDPAAGARSVPEPLVRLTQREQVPVVAVRAALPADFNP
jgi:hypothetical protein